MADPRFLADEMVGRLARWLRMLGADTTYARGWSDEQIARVARDEGRVVVTRDRGLAARSERAVLLTSPRLDEQMREMWVAVPELSHDLRFDRCTLCNGRLAPATVPSGDQSGVPWDRIRAGLPAYRCAECGHLFWEGTHTAQVRRRMSGWTEGSDA